MERRDEEESFWYCVEKVCQRVVSRSETYPLMVGPVTLAMAQQVLDQLGEMRAKTHA